MKQFALGTHFWIAGAMSVALLAAGTLGIGPAAFGQDQSGAAAKDVVFTVSYVTQPAEFDKYAGLRERYFGPPSPKSATVPVPQLASPDFLVQVEAFAAIP